MKNRPRETLRRIDQIRRYIDHVPPALCRLIAVLRDIGWLIVITFGTVDEDTLS